MLFNYNEEENPHVRFVSYSGKYPTLCVGILTLEIDGEKHYFGTTKDVPFPNSKEKIWREHNHDKFWISGGMIDDYNAIHGEWLIDYEALPDELKKYAAQIDEVFNENVEFGCCGGCI